MTRFGQAALGWRSDSSSFSGMYAYEGYDIGLYGQRDFGIFGDVGGDIDVLAIGASGIWGVVFNVDGSGLAGEIFIFIKFGSGAAAGSVNILDFEQAGSGVFKFKFAVVVGTRRDGPEIVYRLFEDNLGFFRGYWSLYSSL